MKEMECKIVATSNFDDPTFAEYEVAYVKDASMAHHICKLLNNYSDDSVPIWYRVKSKDYSLWHGMEEMI